VGSGARVAIKPISDAVSAALKPGKGGVLSYFNNTGITLTLALYAVAVIIYIIPGGGLT
jgi:hypothetical protein